MNEQKFKVGGVFSFSHIRDGKVIDTWEQPNIVVDAGLNYILDAALSGATTSTTHYIGLFSNNYTPIATTAITDLTEVTTKYNETVRPTWNEGGAVSKTISNSASVATFTFNLPENIYGAFLTNINTKGSTAGRLIAASRFASVRSMLALDVLQVTYSLSISST